ncbi:MAG: retroviral-like aspartic protease family protein [Defluviitaleaceae bacterium]|nr:retroviral-like aspartic protease family protein [Defluviitaleaceae bacterium]
MHEVGITRVGGHIIFEIEFVSYNQPTNVATKVMLDSGAYLTVISASTATKFGFDSLPYETVDLHGFTGSTPAKVITVPGIKLAGWLITQVKVLVPFDKEITQEVLGQNVLEYFNYDVKHDEDKIYFSKNPNPKPQGKYIYLLGCGDVFVNNPNEQMNLVQGV